MNHPHALKDVDYGIPYDKQDLQGLLPADKDAAYEEYVRLAWEGFDPAGFSTKRMKKSCVSCLPKEANPFMDGCDALSHPLCGFKAVDCPFYKQKEK